jgi:O-antigen/teichoic acid export membrane protein
VLSFFLANGLFLRHMSPMFARGSSAIRDIFVFTIPVYMGDLFKALNYRMDVFFVSYFQNARDLGFYAAAVGMANLIQLVAAASATNLLPRVASAESTGEDNAARTAQIVRIIFWFNLLCSLALGGVSFWLLPFLYGADFIHSVLPLLLILPGTWLLSLTLILVSYINGIGKTRVNLVISLVSLAATLALDIALIPPYSIIGASVASSIAYSLGAFLSMAYFIHHTQLPATSLFSLNREDTRQVALLVERLKTRTRGAGDA